MPKLNVIKVEWRHDGEAHIYVGDGGACWWTRPVPAIRGGEVWELNDTAEEIEGYYDTPEDAFAAVSEKHDDAPVVVTRDDR